MAFAANDYALAKISTRKTMQSSPVLREFTSDKRLGVYDEFPALTPPPPKTQLHINHLPFDIHIQLLMFILRTTNIPPTSDEPSNFAASFYSLLHALQQSLVQ
jgi:hypothetical protein